MMNSLDYAKIKIRLPRSDIGKVPRPEWNDAYMFFKKSNYIFIVFSTKSHVYGI